MRNSMATIILLSAATQLLPQFVQARESSAIMEEIIVTARKHEERLQDVPMAVSAYSGALLENTGVGSISELYGTAPNVYFVAADFGSDTIGQHLVIRGIGATPIIEPAVGTFIDGVYQPDMGFDMDFLEVERVEILRGPQGTLFGRNTQGGALNIVTRKPGNELEGKFRVSYDEFETIDTQAYVSVPAGDNTAFSLALRYKDSDGFIDNEFLDKSQTSFDQFVAQFRLVSDLGDSFSVDFSVDTKRWRGGMLGAGIPDSGLNSYESFNSDLEESEDDVFGISLRLDWDLPWATLTSITSKRTADSVQMTDTDGREFVGNIQFITVEQETTSQELRLESSSSESAWRWTVGAYWFDESRFMGQEIISGQIDPSFGFLGGLTADQFYDISRTGYAIFGQATYSTGPWEFTLGTRYSEEDPKIDSRVNFTVPNFVLIGLPPTTDFVEGNKTNIDAVTSMGSIAYQFNGDVNIYASISEGFKAGGFQDFQGAPGPEFEPFDNEESINYELGLKARFLDRRLNINLAAFYTDVKEQQIRVRVFTPFPINRVFNVGESHTQGFELELTAMPTDNLLISLSYGYTDTEFDTIDVPADADPSGDINFLAGTPFPFVPKNTGAFSIQYIRPVGNAMEFIAYGGIRYIDSYVTGLNTVADPLNGEVGVQLPEVDSYSLTTFRFSLETEKWTASVYVENAFDENIVLVQQLGSFYTNESFSVLAAPRNIGASFTYHF